MLLDTATAVAALNGLIAQHPLLPADDVAISRKGVSVHLHGGFADFEAWREALTIPINDVAFFVRGGGTTLRADIKFAGVPVALVGYSGPPPTPAATAALKAVA
jgi:hypothetical protein